MEYHGFIAKIIALNATLNMSPVSGRTGVPIADDADSGGAMVLSFPMSYSSVSTVLAM